MSCSRLVRPLLSAILLAGSAWAQFTITGVVNAASRQPTNLAQGGLFAVQGKGVGPADIQQASFPLPTIDGLGGVTIQAAVGGSVVDCIMVYVKPNEVGAILPSGTPLGAGTITVNNNGVSASRAITVVAAAFGIFTQNYGFGSGLAVAFNANGDGTTTPNGATQSVQPGQDVMINGTGLGAITSDETQPGVTDAPATTIQVYVGIKPATVVSAGRGMCCDSLDPNYLIPPGIAAWDVIRFTIPEGVAGCYIPVAVQIGNFISNLAAISIDPSGACALPASTLPPDLAQKLAGQTGIAFGVVNMGRTTGVNINARGVVVTTKADNGSAAFTKYANAPASMFAPNTPFSENVCTINGFPDASGANVHDGSPVTIVPLTAVPLDAGASMMVKGPPGARTIVKRTFGNLFDYPGVTFGDTTAGNYFDPGHYTVTGAGGKDVGPFVASTDVPAQQFVWTNMPDVTQPIDRSKDFTITWTGGIPGTQVTIGGGSNVNGANIAFLCAAPVSAGQLTVPAYVLLNLSATGNSVIPGQLSVGNRSVTLFTAPGLDWGSIAYSVAYTMFPKFQ